MRVDQAQIKELLNYDPDTGLLSWNSRPLKPAGCNTSPYPGKYYRVITIKRVNYLVHRLAWLYTYGEWPDCVDHINGDGLDNRLCNLRNVTRKENNRNKRFKNSLLPGVIWIKDAVRKWRATIGVNGKTIELGNFDDLLDAASARKSAEVRYQYHRNHGS